MSYQLLKEDAQAYHLKDPKGKEIKIAKQALSDALHNKIRNFAKGGRVENPFEGMSAEADPVATPLYDDFQTITADQLPREEFQPLNLGEQMEYGLGKILEPVIAPFTTGTGKAGQEAYQRGLEDRILSARAEAPGIAQAGTPTLMATAKGPVPQDALRGPVVPIGGEATPDQTVQEPGVGSSAQPPLMAPPKTDLDQPLRQMTQAAQMQAKAQEQFYDESRAAQEDANTKLIEINNTYAKNQAALEEQQNNMMQAMMTDKINPNRLWENASTGSKIGAAIGIILGGIGQGLIGGQNQGLAMINRLVDQDIEAQKSELGKKQSLYSMNVQRMRDEQSALLATKAQLAALTEARIAKAAASMGTEQAKAAGMKAVADIQMYRQQLNQQLAQAQTVKQVTDYTKKTGDLRYVDYLPEKQAQELRERAVPGVGIANTKEAATKANELIQSTKAGVDLLKQLKSYAERSGSKFSLEDKADAEILSRMIMGQIREGVLGPGTVNEGERKILESMVRNPTNMTQLPSTAKKSLDRVINTLEDKQRIGLTQYGLTPATKLQRGKPVR